MYFETELILKNYTVRHKISDKRRDNINIKYSNCSLIFVWSAFPSCTVLAVFKLCYHYYYDAGLLLKHYACKHLETVN